MKDYNLPMTKASDNFEDKIVPDAGIDDIT